jgi:hypothetical protein
VIARFAALAAVIVLAAGCTSAAGHAPAASSSARAASARFNEAGLTFRYPAGWQAAKWSDDISPYSWMIVALSTTSQQDPCVRSLVLGAGGGGKVKSICHQPVALLPPGRMLVTWTAQGFPHWHKPVPSVIVGGRPASETFAMASWCKDLGGTKTITVMIPRSLPDNWYQMDACLRGPGLRDATAQVDAMLNSVRIAHGW